MDHRLEALRDWVGTVLDRTVTDIRPASSDASFRRYFRVAGAGGSFIVMDAPPEREDPRRFIAIAARLHALGLHVPEVIEQDLKRGFLLLTDLGERMYLPALNTDTVERLYGDALGALVTLQAGVFADPEFLPPYDEALLRRELAIFDEWFLGTHHGHRPEAVEQTALDAVRDTLVRAALGQARVWVHRDYHSRNLMVTATNNPGILDFQDAVTGPITYDLVSLLRDCYIAWPRARVEEWVLGYHDLARQSGLPVPDDKAQFLRAFDFMGVQRHLKAAGIFARLHHRDGKSGYLADIPRTLGYVLEVSGRYPELHSLHAVLERLQIPGVSA